MYFLCNKNNCDESISLVADIDDTNFKLGRLKVQLGQFFTVADSTHVFIGEIIKIKILIYLLPVLPVTNAKVIFFCHDTH